MSTLSRQQIIDVYLPSEWVAPGGAKSFFQPYCTQKGQKVYTILVFLSAIGKGLKVDVMEEFQFPGKQTRIHKSCPPL